MKFIQMLVAAMLFVFVGSVYAEKPQQVIEQNLDTNGDIKVAIQNTDDNPVPVIIQNGVDYPVPVEVKNTVEANITGGELDVNVVNTVPCEVQGRYQLVGFSTDTNKGQEGVITFTQSCQSDFGPTARMCSSVEVMETVDFPTLPYTYAWVRPVIIGNGYTDVSGVRHWDILDGRFLSCSGWTFTGGNQGLYTGLAIESDGSFWLQECNIDLPTACCAPVQ